MGLQCGAGSWSFGNDDASNVMFFAGDNSSLSHTDICKDIFSVSWRTLGINGTFGVPKKRFSISFSKTNTIFCLILHYNHDNSYLFVNGKEIYNFKADNKNVNFLTQFYLGSISNRFGAVELTILDIIFWDIFMFYQIFLSPQVKRFVIMRNKDGI